MVDHNQKGIITRWWLPCTSPVQLMKATNKTAKERERWMMRAWEREGFWSGPSPVSQIWALMVLLSTWMLLVANSTPMVDLDSRLNSFLVKRESRLDFPTPESPIKTTGNGDPTTTRNYIQVPWQRGGKGTKACLWRGSHIRRLCSWSQRSSLSFKKRMSKRKVKNRLENEIFKERRKKKKHKIESKSELIVKLDNIQWRRRRGREETWRANGRNANQGKKNFFEMFFFL